METKVNIGALVTLFGIVMLQLWKLNDLAVERGEMRARMNRLEAELVIIRQEAVTVRELKPSLEGINNRMDWIGRRVDEIIRPATKP